MADIEQVTYRQRLDKLSLPELADLSERLWGRANNLARRTVEKSWELGGALLAAKDKVDHGEWAGWLKERGISQDIAMRLMRLHSAYPQNLQFADFASVNAALKALSAKAEPGVAPQRPAKRATHKKEVVELVDREELVAAQQEIEDLREYALKAETDLIKAQVEAERVKAELAEVRKKNDRLCEYPGCEDLCDRLESTGWEGDDKHYCREHYFQRVGEWKKRNRAAGLCACGQDPTPGYVTCEPCRQEQNKRNRLYRERKTSSA